MCGGDGVCIALRECVRARLCACVCVCVCVLCVIIKLHITAQSGPVILVILCHSHQSSKRGTCVCVRARVCIY